LVSVFINIAASQACERVARSGGMCNVQSNTTLQFVAFSAQCAQLDNSTTPMLSAAAQTCYAAVSPACQAAVKRLACAHYCQQCIDANTVQLNNYCSPLCDSVIGDCGTCGTPILLSFGGASLCVDPSTNACTPPVDGTPLATTAPTPVPTPGKVTSQAPAMTPTTTLESSRLTMTLPGLLIGLGLGLPLVAILALFIILRGRERIEPHSEEDAGPSHWVGTTKPTEESVAAADAAFERGRAKAGDEETSTLDLESEDEEKPKAAAAATSSSSSKADSKKGSSSNKKDTDKKEVKLDAAAVKKDDSKKAAKKAAAAEESSGEYEYEYVTETDTDEQQAMKETKASDMKASAKLKKDDMAKDDMKASAKISKKDASDSPGESRKKSKGK